MQLLRSSTEKSPLLGGQGHNASGALLRERGQISGANAAVGAAIQHASTANGRVHSQVVAHKLVVLGFGDPACRM